MAATTVTQKSPQAATCGLKGEQAVSEPADDVVENPEQNRVEKIIKSFGKSMAEQKTVGELNGIWAMLLKIALLCFPIFATWSSWATIQIMQNKYFRENGPRFTIDDGKELRRYMMAEDRRLESQILALPPNEWRERVSAVELDQRKILETTARILVEIEHLKKGTGE